MRADKEATPAMRNRPQKLARLRLAEETLFLESIQLFCFPSHAFSIFFIFSPSVTFKTALDTSDTRGEPTGKTCKSLKKKNEKLYTYLSAHERERERESLQSQIHQFCILIQPWYTGSNIVLKKASCKEFQR